MYVANYVVFYSHHLPKIPWQLPLKRVDPPAPGSTRWCVVHIHPESANTLALENGPQIGSNRLAVFRMIYSLRHSTSRPWD